MNRNTLRRRKIYAAALAVSLGISLSATLAPAQAAKKTTLVLGSTQGIPQLNPITRTFAFDQTLYPLLWSGLTKYTPDGSVVPDLATSYKANKEATVWTFNLQPKAKFSDGTPLDAKAVKASFDYARDPKTVTQEATKLNIITSITTSGNKITFNLNSPNAMFAEGMAWVKIIKVSEVASFNKNPSTSGPYKVASFTPNVSLIMVPNTNYFGKKPNLTQIKYVKAADVTAAVTALRTGDIDIMYELPLSDAVPLAKDKSLKIIRAAISSMAVTWEFDLTSAPFNNIKARQAVAYSVNRAQILKAAYYGFGTVSTYNTIVADKSPWNCGAAGGLTTYNYDPAKAKALFAEAGLTKFTWWGVSGALPEFDAMGQVLQASLKEIGITMDIQNSEVGTWAAKFYPAGKTYPGLLLPNYQSVPSEPGFSMNFLLSGRAESNWNNTTFDALYKKAIGTLDKKARKAVWCDALKLENAQLPLITPFVFSVLHAAKANVMGAWVEGGGQLHLESVSVK
jgi:peptide/nickel transport system substrate-binding protein